MQGTRTRPSTAPTEKIERFLRAAAFPKPHLSREALSRVERHDAAAPLPTSDEAKVRAPSTPFACSPRTKAYYSTQCTAAKAPRASLTTPSAACSPKAPKYAFSTPAAPSAYTATSTPSSTTTPPPHRKPPTTNHHHINQCNTFNSSFSSLVSRQYARLPSPTSSPSSARARKCLLVFQRVPTARPGTRAPHARHTAPARTHARAEPHERHGD